MSKLNAFTIRVDNETKDKISNIAKEEGEEFASVARDLLKLGLAYKLTNESKDMLADLIREQLAVVLKPSIERLATLESKTGHMAATAAFLNVQAFMDLVPKDRKKDVRTLYENARKMAVQYMKSPAEEWKWNEEKEKK